MREFSADSLVTLPKLNVDSGLALWQALRAVVVAENHLPKFLQSAWQSVDRAGSELSQVAQQRLSDSLNKAPPAERRKADTTVDNAVGALDQFLQGWARLPDTLPEAQLAAAIRQTLFPDGTGFLKMPFEQEWAQIDRRIALIKSEGIDKQISTLGGRAFVTHLQEAQKAYGKALGLTTAPATPAETVTVREPLTALVSALRVFVFKVAAYGDDQEPETAALTERLLRPVRAWTSKATKPSGDNPPVSLPVPAPAAG